MTQPAVTPTPPAPFAPPSAPSAPKPPSPPPPKESSVKETLESILVAFILAFIFRAFVVEAFVIPTGSMAPTLLGAHMRFRCPDCGYRFDTNYSPTQRGDDLIIPSTSSEGYRVFCPNCGYKFSQMDASQPPVHYGDRILVLKYLYLFREPQRWDVVVFKSPDNDPGDPPKPPSYTQNYIKRLIGKPGESIMILDGDIYVGRGDQDPSQYTVQTKPRYAQEALWRVVYDNDFHPQKLPRATSEGAEWKQPWTVRDGSGWDMQSGAGGRIFKFDNSGGESTLFFDREANPIFDRQLNGFPYAFTDFLAYDVEQDPLPQQPNFLLYFGQMNIVHDLKLAFAYDRTAGDGPLRAKINTGTGDTFIAVLSPTDARLYHKTASEERQVGAPMPLPRSGEPLRVELTNVDYQATLRVNDRIVAATTPQEYHPDVKTLLDEYRTARLHTPPTVEIDAAKQTCSLSHVGLWRDVYYLNRSQGSAFAGTPRNIMHLGDEEYFVLGDNSLISGDARYWRVPIDLPADRLQVPAGRVPGRFMLGRAFFVYWPAGFRPAPFLPGLAPDFGDMRFIR